MTKTQMTALLPVVLTAGLITGCVHVIEKEVIVEKPVYIEVAANEACTTKTDLLYADARNFATHVVPASATIMTQFGMGIGPGMSLDEREVLNRHVQTTLDTNSDGAGVRWTSRNGQVMEFMTSETRQEERLVTVERGEEVGRLPDSLAVEPAIYVTTEAAPLRPTPSPTSLVTGGPVPTGEKVKVLGRVTGINDDSWMLVGGADGTAYGYLEPAQLTPNETNLVEPKDLYVRATGKRLRDALPAYVTCRTLDYRVNGSEERMRACREPGGRWIADPPYVGENGSCSANPQPPFLIGRDLP